MAIRWIDGPKNGKVEFEGAVLTDVYERYLGHDRYSDRVDIWTGEKVISVEIAAGYYTMTTVFAKAEKDADAVTLEKAKTWRSEQEWARAKKLQEKRELREVLTPAKGKLVKVYKGRKVPIGTIGTLFWEGYNRYNPNNPRIGIKDSTGKAYWTYKNNVEVLIG